VDEDEGCGMREPISPKGWRVETLIEVFFFFSSFSYFGADLPVGFDARVNLVNETLVSRGRQLLAAVEALESRFWCC